MVSIASDSSELIIDSGPGGTFTYDVETAPSVLRFGRSEAEAIRGPRIHEDDRGTLEVEGGENVYAYNSDASETAEIKVERAGFFLNFGTRQTFSGGTIGIEIPSGGQVDPRGAIDPSDNRVDPGHVANGSGINSDTITPDSSGKTFVDKAVSDGHPVHVQNQTAAGGDAVFVQDEAGNDAYRIDPGESVKLFVSNTNQITITGATSKPTVVATWMQP